MRRLLVGSLVATLLAGVLAGAAPARFGGAFATGARVMVFGTRGARRPLPPADENGDTLAPGNIPNLPAAPNPPRTPQQNGANGHAE